MQVGISLPNRKRLIPDAEREDKEAMGLWMSNMDNLLVFVSGLSERPFKNTDIMQYRLVYSLQFSLPFSYCPPQT